MYIIKYDTQRRLFILTRICTLSPQISSPKDGQSPNGEQPFLFRKCIARKIFPLPSSPERSLMLLGSDVSLKIINREKCFQSNDLRDVIYFRHLARVGY